MSTAVTHEIKITARSRFEAAHSDPRNGRFLFSYRITIRNNGRETMQLKRRHWVIRDSLAAIREVEGPGVVGETPILQPGQEFAYSSACDLSSGLGRMDGTYDMIRVADGQRFKVDIPTIVLAFPFTGN